MCRIPTLATDKDGHAHSHDNRYPAPCHLLNPEYEALASLYAKDSLDTRPAAR